MRSHPASPPGCCARRRARSPIEESLSALMREAAEPFGDLHELCASVERFADAKVVLLGEATHGTAEFYQARARITEMLVDRHGFNIVAVEADWPDAAIYDAYVRGLPRPKVPKTAFTRFPTWMWRNGQVAEFLDRLKEHQRNHRRAGAEGWFLRPRHLQPRRLDRGGARLSRQGRSGGREGRARALWLPHALARGAGRLRAHGALPRLCDVREAGHRYAGRSPDASGSTISIKDGEAFFDAEQNARIVAGAEQYYRAIYYGDAASWNLRDQHMFDTLERLHRRARAGAPRPWSGRTTPISAMPPSPRWARCGASTISASWRASASATTRR